MERVLIIDDDANFASSLSTVVERQGFEVDCVSSYKDGKDLIQEGGHELVLVDLNLPDGDGLGLIADAPEGHPGNFVVITGHPSVETAVGALKDKDRVVDYLVKPVNTQKIKKLLATASSRLRAKKAAADPQDSVNRPKTKLIGTSAKIIRLVRDIEKLAHTKANIFIQGESGSGKELVAQMIHHHSNRSGPMYAVNCSISSEDGFGETIFGSEGEQSSEKTSQTIGLLERAHNGTLFLDEITNMPIAMQAQLLRVIEEGAYRKLGSNKEVAANVRIVTSTNQLPTEAIAAGTLREDLYYRLSELPVQVPPLRERGEDVQRLALYFVNQLNEEHQKDKSIPADTLQGLSRYHWPGNVRELHHAIHHAYVTSDQYLVFPQAMTEGDGSAVQKLNANSLTTIAEMEKQLIEHTLDRLEGDKQLAAQTLGVSLKTLYNRLNQYRRPKHKLAIRPQ